MDNLSDVRQSNAVSCLAGFIKKPECVEREAYICVMRHGSMVHTVKAAISQRALYGQHYLEQSCGQFSIQTFDLIWRVPTHTATTPEHSIARHQGSHLILTRGKQASKATCHGGAWGERGYTSYSILTSALDGGEWSASRPGERTPTVQEVGWAPEPVWTQRSEEKVLCPCRGSNPVHPVVHTTGGQVKSRGSNVTLN
jgi:hypothetical protein